MAPTDDPYKIRDIVSNFAEIADGYATASETARRKWRFRADIQYGAHPDERLDLFFPAGPDTTPKPVHLFVHGGYWRANIKENYALMAETVCGAGAIAVIVEYTLMPKARMGVLVDQIRRAARWVHAHAGEFGGDPDQLSASGQSAGGHLVSYLAARGPSEAETRLTPMRALLPVSGIFDLAPIPHSFLQPELHLTPEEVASWTPLTATPIKGPKMTIAVGAEETAPFLRDSPALAARLKECGVTADLAIVPAVDHMTIMRDMGVPDSPMGKLVTACIEASRT